MTKHSFRWWTVMANKWGWRYLRLSASGMFVYTEWLDKKGRVRRIPLE